MSHTVHNHHSSDPRARAYSRLANNQRKRRAKRLLRSRQLALLANLPHVVSRLLFLGRYPDVLLAPSPVSCAEAILIEDAFYTLGIPANSRNYSIARMQTDILSAVQNNQLIALFQKRFNIA